uniref:Alpha-type protein kinase domain-containing protein n=1 Tax=Macrostomum lignano TaxID=282301 RepID=A0A1I8FCD7_9PLAT
MPELGCEVSIEDLCCDADDEGGNSNASAALVRRPRRLTLQAAPKVQPESAEFPSWRQRGGRIRTMSEPPSPADEDEAAEQAAAHSNEPGNEFGRRRRQRGAAAVLSPNSRWPKALLLASRSVYKDPWRDKPVLSAPEEDAVRHLYNPHRREWVQDRVPACNYVAKKYIEEVDNSVYFEDVRLQMNAKLWAQEYNRHQPPK